MILYIDITVINAGIVSVMFILTIVNLLMTKRYTTKLQHSMLTHRVEVLESNNEKTNTYTQKLRKKIKNCKTEISDINRSYKELSYTTERKICNIQDSIGGYISEGCMFDEDDFNDSSEICISDDDSSEEFETSSVEEQDISPEWEAIIDDGDSGDEITPPIRKVSSSKKKKSKHKT